MVAELDAVSAGGWLSLVEGALKSFFTNPVVAGIAGALILGGGIGTVGGPCTIKTKLQALRHSGASDPGNSRTLAVRERS